VKVLAVGLLAIALVPLGVKDAGEATFSPAGDGAWRDRHPL